MKAFLIFISVFDIPIVGETGETWNMEFRIWNTERRVGILSDGFTQKKKEDFFLLFRFYGPKEPVFDKSFVLQDIEKIK